MVSALARLLCGLLLLSALSPAHAAHSEYEVKAAFIHNVAKFVEWPSGTSRADYLKLCVLGQNTFDGALDALRGKQVGARRWAVAGVDVRDNLKECDVLFIAASEDGNLGRALEAVRGAAVLTLGDTRGYAQQGVMVNFYLDEGKVRFEINQGAAGRAGIKLSSKLVQVGRLVDAAK